jgi:hypothetical protein
MFTVPEGALPVTAIASVVSVVVSPCVAQLCVVEPADKVVDVVARVTPRATGQSASAMPNPATQ